MLKNLTLVAFASIFSVLAIFGQTPQPSPPLAPASLETVLAEAEKQRVAYQEEFKNLLATETKTFERYGKNGEMKDQTTVESNFLVYQSSKSTNVASEVRNVVKVDGKMIPEGQAKADQFFAELEKEKTLQSELNKIQKEGSKYDKTLEISGLTLYEGVVLSSAFRPYFDFSLAGTENYQGSDVYVVNYQQTRKSPYITLNGKGERPNELNLDYTFSVPGGLKNKDAFLRGKLWIDANTYQIRREERQLIIQDSTPVVALETVFDYQPSEYNILVPKQIALTSNEIAKKDGSYVAVKDTKVTFDYSKFRKSNVDVVILDDNE